MWEWISNFISHRLTLYRACDYLTMLGLKLNHVSKRGPICHHCSLSVAEQGLTQWGKTLHRADSRFAPSQWELALLCNPSLIGWAQARNQPWLHIQFRQKTGLCLGCCFSMCSHYQTNVQVWRLHQFWNHFHLTILLVTGAQGCWIINTLKLTKPIWPGNW